MFYTTEIYFSTFRQISAVIDSNCFLISLKAELVQKLLPNILLICHGLNFSEDCHVNLKYRPPFTIIHNTSYGTAIIYTFIVLKGIAPKIKS